MEQKLMGARLVLLSLFFHLNLIHNLVSPCDEVLCVSVVSKCSLLRSCDCDIGNYKCYKECHECYGHLYAECFSCSKLSSRPKVTSHLMMHSHVGDLDQEMPHLFQMLTEEEDLKGRWTALTYPVSVSWLRHTSRTTTTDLETASTPIANGTGENNKISVDEDEDEEAAVVNCTVAYKSRCMSVNKCKNGCFSMGASHYRWFYDGCCECVGKTCMGYGIDESRCSACPLDDEEGEEENEIDSDS